MTRHAQLSAQAQAGRAVGENDQHPLKACRLSHCLGGAAKMALSERGFPVAQLGDTRSPRQGKGARTGRNL